MNVFDGVFFLAVVLGITGTALIVGGGGAAVWHEKTARRFSQEDVATFNKIAAAWTLLGFVALFGPLAGALLLPFLALISGVALVPFAMARLARSAADYLLQDDSILAADQELGDAGRGARIRRRNLLATRMLLVVALFWAVGSRYVYPLVARFG